MLKISQNILQTFLKSVRKNSSWFPEVVNHRQQGEADLNDAAEGLAVRRAENPAAARVARELQSDLSACELQSGLEIKEAVISGAVVCLIREPDYGFTA